MVEYYCGMIIGGFVGSLFGYILAHLVNNIAIERLNNSQKAKILKISGYLMEGKI